MTETEFFQHAEYGEYRTIVWSDSYNGVSGETSGVLEQSMFEHEMVRMKLLGPDQYDRFRYDEILAVY